MPTEQSSALRAWVDYYRDLGVHDFYRRGESPVAASEPVEAAAVSVEETVSVVLAGHGPAAVPTETATPPIPSPVEDERPPIWTTAELAVPQPAQLLSFDQLAPLPAGPVPAAERAAVLKAIQDDIGDCTRCPLAYAGRHKIVFADGAPTARLMFIGEGPGADEDAQGLPFVGRAGQLLNNMIAAMGLKREEVYIANIVKCRPPGNRVPEPVEAQTCSQFLLRQIDVVQPEVIVALGSTAATYLLGVRKSLSALRGRWHNCRGAKLAVTYHPAFLLRDPRQKAEAWKDLQMVMAEMGLTPPAKKMT
ncbi:MAG TPA: uracil-DNA glycosylase family protein [Acidobacteriaceae bacterium]|nr:uracil-DNA glycosylase family protein [Acidobacteriaceae bacterium]